MPPVRRELLLQRGDILTQLPVFERGGERHVEIGLLERLADEVGRAELHGLDDGRGAVLAGQHDDRHIAIDLLERGQRVEAAHRARKHHVENHGRRPLGLIALERVLGTIDRDGVITPLLQIGSQELAHHRIVVDDHDGGAFDSW